MKNIILISLDNLRYDCIGYQPDKKELLKHDVLKYLETPTLDEIAEKSLCFTQCISPGTYTTAVHASVLTGLYPPGHGVRAFYQTKLNKNVYTLAEILKVFGYKTVMATDTRFLFKPLDLNRGFDHIFEKDDFNLFRFIEKNKEEKIFLFVHFYDIHEPFMFSEHKGFDNSDYFKTLKNVYKRFNITFPSNVCEGALIWKTLNEKIVQNIDVLLPLYVKGVTKFDKNRLRVFIDNLKRIKLLDDGLMILFSDHGEGKISNKAPVKFSHGGDVFDNVIRVPLLLYHQDIPGKVLDKLVSLVDIFPTIIKLALEKEVKELLPFQLDGQTLISPKEREYVYSERWFLKMTKLHFNLAMASSILWQRAIRTKGKKYILYGEPEGLSEDAIGTMDNREFLKAVYRKCMCKFENYDEYMKNLHMLNTGELSKREFYNRFGTERFEIYDLERDPYEENPIIEYKDSGALSSYKSRILDLSTPSVQTEEIFPPLNKAVVERIAKNMFLDEREEAVSIVTGNKNLFNDLIGEFLARNKDLSGEEFLKKCYRIFLDKEPERKYFDQLTNLIREGVARETVFMTKIFQQVEFSATNVPGKNTLKKTEKSYGEKRNKEEEIARKEELIKVLRGRLKEKESLLEQILSSKTWRIGQLYGRIIGRFKKKINLKLNSH